MKDPKPVTELAVHLARLSSVSAFRIARAVETLARLGKQAHRLAERHCNGEVSTEQADRATDWIASRASNVLYDLGLDGYAIKVTGDPRGYCLRIRHPKIPGNTWGGDSAGFGL